MSLFMMMSLAPQVVVNGKENNDEDETTHLKNLLSREGYEDIVSKCMEWDKEGYLDSDRLRLQAPDYWLMCTQLVLEEKLK